MAAVCVIEGCDRRGVARGLCKYHHTAAARDGCLDQFPSTRVTGHTRLALLVEADAPGCWPWPGALNKKGYGTIDVVVNGRRYRSAHRFAYEQLVGPIPDGLELDHLCRNPPCVNPAHLEPVTRSENVRRGDKARRRNREGQPLCINGHVVAGDNARPSAQFPGFLHCRACEAMHARNLSARRRAEC